MKYRSSLLDEEALVLEANKALNRGKAPFFCVSVSAPSLALETQFTGVKGSTSHPLLSVYKDSNCFTGNS